MTAVGADQIFDVLVTGLPPAARQAASGLAGKVGLADAAGGFSQYVGLRPCLDLPWFAVESATDEATDPQLEAFRRAHWYGGFHWLLADRIADGQLARSADVSCVVEALEEGWRNALADAVGSRVRGDELVAWTQRTVKRAVAAEQERLKARHLERKAYARIVDEKLCWVRLSAAELLRQTDGRERAAAFERISGVLFASLQCLDDAVDEADDAKRFGCGFPAALGLRRGALLFCAVRLTAAAELLARRARFSRFAEWLARRTEEVQARVPRPDLTDTVGALALEAAIFEHWTG